MVLLMNVHLNLEVPEPGKTYFVEGNYEYFHYLCDGFDDRGWGCGYRTLQSICSWINYNGSITRNVPTIREIQQILVDMEDKPKSFLGSREWIGSVEVCLVVDKLYEVPCKIVHVHKGENLHSIVAMLQAHFEQKGSPLMMGGDVDCSSKGIMGIHTGENDDYLLIMDPHYVGKEESAKLLQNKGWVKWQPLKDFLNSSFYNLCIPQIKAKCKSYYNVLLP